MKLVPYGQRIVVRPVSEETRSGLVLPDEVKKKSLVGVVIETGPDCQWVVVGHTVLFAKYSGFELPMMQDSLKEYDSCRLMNEDELLSRIVSENDMRKGEQ